TGKFSWKNMNSDRRMMIMVIIATLILVPVYFFKDFFTARQGDGDIAFEGVAFLFTALLLFLSDRCSGTKTGEKMKVADAVTVGLFQCVALFPGVSRSGSTTAAGLFCGLEKNTAVTFAFVLGIPAILGGSVVEFKEVMETQVEVDWLAMAIGFVVSAVVGFLAIKLVSWLLKSNRFKIFGVYTLVIGVACLAGGIWEHITGNTIAGLIGI
ncbi:MAG: undecaprenyl-diphosphate phosphatase, partial [Oscillospiraceae bacterium]